MVLVNYLWHITCNGGVFGLKHVEDGTIWGGLPIHLMLSIFLGDYDLHTPLPFLGIIFCTSVVRSRYALIVVLDFYIELGFVCPFCELATSLAVVIVAFFLREFVSTNLLRAKPWGVYFMSAI